MLTDSEPLSKKIIQLFKIKKLYWSICQIQSKNLSKMHFENCFDFQNERLSRSKSHCTAVAFHRNPGVLFNACFWNSLSTFFGFLLYQNSKCVPFLTTWLVGTTSYFDPRVWPIILTLQAHMSCFLQNLYIMK